MNKIEAMLREQEIEVMQIGMRHYREGIPRHKNPCVFALVNAGKRSDRVILSDRFVCAWFAGWDIAKAKDGAKATGSAA